MDGAVSRRRLAQCLAAASTMLPLAAACGTSGSGESETARSRAPITLSYMLHNATKQRVDE